MIWLTIIKEKKIYKIIEMNAINEKKNMIIEQIWRMGTMIYCIAAAH